MLAFGVLFISGACFGSFLTVVAERLPQGLSIIKPRSHCALCQTSLKPLDLIPIYAFIRLKGHCRYCGQPFTALSFIMECYWGCLVCLIHYLGGWHLYYLPIHLLLVSASLLSLTDYLYWLVVPQLFYAFLLLISLTINLIPTSLALSPLEALVIYCLLSLVASGKKEGLGGGDIKLLTSWTFVLGYYAVTVIILIASSLALSVYLATSRSQKKIPFVPYLSVGLLVYLLYHLAH